MFRYMWSECAPTRRLLPTLPSLAGWRGECGERGTCAQFLSSPLAAAQVEACLEGHAAAAGSRWRCWLSQECPAPSLSRVLCCRLCLTFAHTHKFAEGKTQAWKEVALHSPPSAGPAGPAGTGGAPTAAAELLYYSAASHYIRALARACICVVSECAPTRRVLSTSSFLAGWLGDRLAEGWLEKRDRVRQAPPALAAAQVEAWLEEHAAAAGSGGSC